MLASCDDYPRDPNGTLKRVLAGETMRVVAVENDPWVMACRDRSPCGAEVDLVEAFARDLGVEVEWHHAPAFAAFEALGRGDADLAIGGFTASAVEVHPGAAHTIAYFTARLVVAAEPAAPVPDDIEGQRVLVPPGLMAERLVEDEGAIPVSSADGGASLVLLWQWQIPESGLVPTSVDLRTDEHVMAVPAGENAWLMRLERFLRSGTGDIGARLRQTAS